MSSMDGFINNEGIQVIEHRLLPYAALVDVCNIETKKQFTIDSGHEINCIQSGRILYVSKELYEKMRKL